MSKAVDTNVFNTANALDVQAPNPCVFGCGAKIRYGSTLLDPSYREVDTNLHHSFKRCADLIGELEVAKQRFQRYTFTDDMGPDDQLSGKLFDTGTIEPRAFVEYVASNLQPGTYPLFSMSDSAAKGE
jgi:hypothetical protein